MKSKALGNISNLKVFKVDELMGLEIDPIRMAAFADGEIKPLPPNTPLVKSPKTGNVSDRHPFGSSGQITNRCSFSSFRRFTSTKARSNWKRISHSILLPAAMEGGSLDEQMIREMIEGQEETAPHVAGPVEILAQLENDMESLLNAVDTQNITNESVARFDDHVRQLKEQLVAQRQDPAAVLRQVNTGEVTSKNMITLFCARKLKSSESRRSRRQVSGLTETFYRFTWLRTRCCRCMGHLLANGRRSWIL